MKEILPLLKNNFLTKNLNEKELTKLAFAMRPVKYTDGEILIQYGAVGKEYFILAKGSVKVTVYKPGTAASDPELSNKVLFTKTLEQGCGFGELALLYNDKRSATITAIGPCEAYTLDGTVFKTLIVKSSIEKRSRKADFLNKIKLFDQLDKL